MDSEGILTSRDTLGSRYTTPGGHEDDGSLYECSNTYRCPLEYDLRVREMLKFVRGRRTSSYPEIDL